MINVYRGLLSNSHHICLTHFGPSPFDRDSAETAHKDLYTRQQLQYYKKKGIIACDHLEFRLSQLQLVGKVSKIISKLGMNKIIQKNQEPVQEKDEEEVKEQEQEKKEKRFC